MKRLMITSVIALVATCAVAREAYFVSPTGDDASDGRTEQRAFRTLARARDAARLSGGGQITLADGVYEAAEPLVFTEADANLIIQAAEGATPVISAGRRITNWKVDAKGWWHAALPAGESGFAQFYVNGERRTRPYLPREGYYFVRDAVPKDPACTTERFLCETNEFPVGENPDLEVCLFHVWTMSRSKVVSYDAAQALVTLDIAPFKNDYDRPNHSRWYRFDNVKSALGQPGDWYCDRAAREIIYVPKAGERPNQVEAVVSYHRHAAQFVGAYDIAFVGVVFAYSDYGVQPGGNYCAQAAANQPGGVQIEGAERIRFADCAFLHTGAYGLAYVKGAKEGAAVRCEFVDLGAGGVRIGDGWMRDKSCPLVRECRVVECLVEGGGRVDPAGVGVWIGHARNNRVSHCTIHDLYYSGISCGWNWSFAETARDNILEWNHIYDIGQHVLSDMGGIYLLGRQPGTVERYNHIHHITRARNCGFGVYFDSGTSLVTVSNSVVHDCQDSNWFTARIAASNRVVNNIFAYGDAQQLCVPPRNPSSLMSTFAHNLIQWDIGKLTTSTFGDHVTFADNLYFCPAERKPKTDVKGFTFGEPGFAAPEKRDFTLKPNAAVASVGFQPFSLEGCGRRAPRRFTVEGAKVPPVFTYAAFPEKNIDEDFESTAVGSSWSRWSTYPANVAGEMIRVTEETAAHGKRSLEVKDMLADWPPHMWCDAGRNSGTHRISFAIKVEPGAAPTFELRESAGDVPPDSPQVGIAGDGTLRARGRVLAQVPFNQWIELEMDVPLDEDRARDTFTLRLKVKGASTRTFDDLPFCKRLHRVGWFGFMSCAPAKGARYWIDDFRVTDISPKKAKK